VRLSIVQRKRAAMGLHDCVRDRKASLSSSTFDDGSRSSSIWSGSASISVLLIHYNS